MGFAMRYLFSRGILERLSKDDANVIWAAHAVSSVLVEDLEMGPKRRDTNEI